MYKALLFLTAFSLPISAYAQSSTFAGTGTVSYEIVHKFHKVVGTSKALVAKGAIDGTGLKAMARAQVQTFDSGNSNRDAHMMEAVEAAKFPWVTVRLTSAGFKLPNAASTVRVDAEVELHGVTVRHLIDLQITPKDGKQYLVKFSFPEKLTEHKVKRPSLLLIPVEDDLRISGEVLMQARP